MAKLVRFGLKNVHYAPEEEEDFGTIGQLLGAVQMTTSPEGDSNTFYADDGAYFVTETKGGGNNDIRVSKKEDTKIRCARKHFEAIGSPDLEYNVRTTYHSIGF